MKSKSLKPLAVTFALSGVWDTIAGFLYIFVIGTGRSIDNPPTHPFYAVFLGSFFFCVSLTCNFYRHLTSGGMRSMLAAWLSAGCFMSFSFTPL
jgi:uncharacterized YccA/Bax inhibitor family protein